MRVVVTMPGEHTVVVAIQKEQRAEHMHCDSHTPCTTAAALAPDESAWELAVEQ